MEETGGDSRLHRVWFLLYFTRILYRYLLYPFMNYHRSVAYDFYLYFMFNNVHVSGRLRNREREGESERLGEEKVVDLCLFLFCECHEGGG